MSAVPREPSASEGDIVAAAERALADVSAVRKAVGAVIFGQEQVIERALVALFSGGHALLVGVPGLAKTKLVETLGTVLGLDTRRIQFTPDLMPSDILGAEVMDQDAEGRRGFRFVPGPVFAQLLMADEINRATPRTQSALLEAMQEQQTTSDGQTYALPRPFLVLATQNPIELEGTFPLPEAQLDRFLMQVQLGYPSEAQEEEILMRYGQNDPLVGLKPVVAAADVVALQAGVRQVHVNPDVRRYITRVTRATRVHAAVELGVSPRGTLALFRASQALAAVRGRDYVIPSDVQHLCGPVLTHRVHVSPQVRLRGRTPAQVVAEITASVPVPVAE